MNILITQNGPGGRALKTGGPAAGAVLGFGGQARAVQIPHQGLLAVLHIRVEQAGVCTPVAQAVGHMDPHLLACGGGLGLNDGGAAVALADNNALLLEQGHRCAQLCGPACGRNAGCACADNHDVVILDLVGGDVAQLNGGGLHFLHGHPVGDDGLGLVGIGSLGGDALGLVDAALRRLADGVGRQGRAGHAVDLAGLGIQHLLNQLLCGVLAVACGLAGNVQLNVGDLLGVKGHGDLHFADALRRSGVGAGGVGAGCRARSGGGTAGAVAGGQSPGCDTAHGGGRSQLQEVFAGNLLVRRNIILSFVCGGTQHTSLYSRYHRYI